MQLCIRGLACLALLVGVLAMAAMASNIKVVECCTEASIKPITAPIVGYRIQRKHLPCIRAVIFETTDGEVCSHYKQEWVFERIRELEKARRASTTPVPANETSSP